MEMGMDTLRHPDTLAQRISGREVYIWGARHEGYAARLALQRHDIPAAGYIDSSPSLAGTFAFGLPVTSPTSFFDAASPEVAFIVVASGFFADDISESCLARGWVKNADFAVYGELRRFNYQVDVAGMCNLRCISCPRGNWPRHRTPGFMSATTYARLVDKILRDDPWTGIMTLYNWGEPLLNPELPEILKITRHKGLLSAVSSNLAMTKDFEEVIRAGPDWFRISNSGWGKHYETTHTGARWDTFHANCRKISDYRRRHQPNMIIEFFFHIYEHNRQDYPAIQAWCRELGFILRYRHAALAPLDNVERVVDGEPLTEAASRTRALQFLGVEEVMEIARAERHRPCYYLDHLWIDWDLSVAHCMEWYDPALRLLPQDFLTVELDDIARARAAGGHCRRCMEKGIHRAYCVYGDETLIAAKSSIPVQQEG